MNTSHAPTRRGFLRGGVSLLLALMAGAAAWSGSTSWGQSCMLENSCLRYCVSAKDGRLVDRRFENRLTHKRLDLPPEEFRLEFQDGATIGGLDCNVKISGNRTSAELLAEHASGLEVRVRYSLSPEKPYLRKQISLRQKAGAARRLMRADLENWNGIPADWRSPRADRYPYGSHPIYCEDLWAGVEFVAAFNEYAADGFVLRSRPGGPKLGSEWLALHPTVIGVAERGQVRPAFLRYIEDIRRGPPRLVACYNSWWTLPKRFSEKNLLDLAADLKRRLYDKHGVFFDFVAIDAGWSEPQSIWQVDRQHLPRGFDPLRQLVESAKGRLGLWISPSAFYPLATDCDWAGRTGFTVVKYVASPGRYVLTGISLADPAYLAKTQAQLKRLVRENRFGHVKFDGLIPAEPSPHHDLLPGKDSVEPLVQGALSLLDAAKEADPDLVTEPTFLNSWFTYISPWLIQHADTLFGNAGGDYPRAIGPAPDYRESCTNAREWYIFSSLDEIWLPQNALQYFDIIHCDAAGGLANHLAMAVGRGRFFLPVYVNPKHVSDLEWQQFAGWLRWARTNQDLLRQTVVLRSRVEEGEPYCYAHWQRRRGLLAVRNPSNESKSYRVDLGASGAPHDLADAVAYTQYPCRRGIAKGLRASDPLEVRLQPWELAFVEIVPRSELREPVAMGGRWYRDAEGRMRVYPKRGVREVEVLLPGGKSEKRACAAEKTAEGGPSGKLIAQTINPLPKTEWLQVQGKAHPSVILDLEARVSIAPHSARARVLLLLQSPDRNQVLSNGKATINGRETKVEVLSSAGQMGYAGGTHGFDPKSYWAGMIPHENEWTWLICEVPPGQSQVRFNVRAAPPRVKIGLWVWSERDCAAGQIAIPLPCSRPEMPQYQDQLEREGMCLLRPERRE